jgi:predicted CXXCH cytochrome family protein
MRVLSRFFAVMLGGVAGWAAVVPYAAAVTGPHNMHGQVCIACHTPHKAPNSHLLWNHVLSASNFSWSDWLATTGGTPLPANIKTWSGSTKLCLSCHDGTVEIGRIYEPPITYNSTKITGEELTAPGGDLKGNHPVSVPYPSNGAKNTYNGITTGDNALASGWIATPTKVKIYEDASAAGPNNRGIECSSCHDPHDNTRGNYLRDNLAASALCLNCHVK